MPCRPLARRSRLKPLLRARRGSRQACHRPRHRSNHERDGNLPRCPRIPGHAPVGAASAAMRTPCAAFQMAAPDAMQAAGAAVAAEAAPTCTSWQPASLPSPSTPVEPWARRQPPTVPRIPGHAPVGAASAAMRTPCAAFQMAAPDAMQAAGAAVAAEAAPTCTSWQPASLPSPSTPVEPWARRQPPTVPRIPGHAPVGAASAAMRTPCAAFWMAAPDGMQAAGAAFAAEAAPTSALWQPAGLPPPPAQSNHGRDGNLPRFPRIPGHAPVGAASAAMRTPCAAFQMAAPDAMQAAGAAFAAEAAPACAS